MSNGLTKAEKEVLRERLKSEKAVLKALEKQYETALEEIDDKIASLLGRGDADLPHVIHQVQYQRLIKAQVKAALDRLHAGEYETIDKYLRDSYTDGFVGTLYNLHRQDVPVIVPIEQEAAIKAVTIDSKLKEPLYESLGVDVTKLKKTISAEITRGIAAGYSYGEMAQGIRLLTKAPLSRTRTIVRTEAGRVQEQANFDAANKAKAAGADVVKQWSAVLDGKTRDTHRELDHQIREMDKPFETHGKKAMYPHDFGDPAEDCNCRCTLLTRARAALDADELKVMQKRAEFFGLDKTDSFAEFKEKYLKAAQTVENIGKSGIIISDKQLGHKAGKHMNEWGLNVSSAEDRARFIEITKNIRANAQEVRRVQWLHDPETGRRTVEVNGYILGEDVVLVKDDGEYITTMRGGINNGRVKNGRVIK